MPQIHIFIKTPSDDKSICLSVADDAAISYLKMIIEDQFARLNLPPLNWRFHYLLYQGKIILDNFTLGDLNIKSDATIWIRTKSTKNAFRIKTDQHQSNLKSAALVAKSRNYFRGEVLPKIQKNNLTTKK